MSKTVYIVMKLQKKVETTRLGETYEVEVQGKDFEGYLPVFNTEEEAIIQSQKGKYNIVTAII